jgi:tetratricopeptide (TPR) repeat protein
MYIVPESEFHKRGETQLRLLAIIVLFTLPACASIGSRTAGLQTYDYANVLFEQGLYADAHDAYRSLAESYPKSHLTEEAEYRAAYTLIFYKNHDRDYDLAQREFSEFVQRYPSSGLSGEAQSWLVVLKSFDRSKTHEFMTEVESLSKKINNLWTEIENHQTTEEKISRERDALLAEKEDLSKKADELLKEKDRLINEKNALIAERDGLVQDKIALQKRVLALTEEKDKLIVAKKKLEKSLHDLTMVDVKMEKQRKKLKKEETTKESGSAPR